MGGGAERQQSHGVATRLAGRAPHFGQGTAGVWGGKRCLIMYLSSDFMQGQPLRTTDHNERNFHL